MKKFNPEVELCKIQNNNKKNNNCSIKNIFIPIFIIGCSCLAMMGITFSFKMVKEDKYNINISIINGEEDAYVKKVLKGPFRDILKGKGEFGSISCTSGKLDYDPVTETISAIEIDENVNCVIAFKDYEIEGLDISSLNKVNDNFGVSYYYKADSLNNYFMFNNMLFRVVRINGNGTLRLLLEDSILSANYGEINNFEDSNVKQIMDNWFVNNFNGKVLKYIVEGDYDIQNYIDYDSSNLIDFDGYYNSYVGTLSVREVDIINKNVNGKNYLNSNDSFYLGNSNGAYNAYAFIDNEIKSVDANKNLKVKPVINIKFNSLKGTGTRYNPYQIED